MKRDYYNAIVCKNTGSIDNLELNSLKRKKLNRDEVRVEVRACGVNFPDKLMIEGQYQFKPKLPFIPGLEVSGVISETFNNNKKISLGSKVMCQLRFGGYSEEVVVNKNNIIHMPLNFSFEEAAGFRVAAQTAYVSLVERAKIKKEETLLVLGAAGGVGLAGVQLGKALGANVIAVSSSKQKQKICKEMGAHYSIGYNDLKNNILDITFGKGVDIIYDPVGGDSFSNALKCIKWGGRFLIIGFAGGSIPSLPINIALIKGISVLGIRAGEYFRRFPEKKESAISNLFKIADSGLINPKIHKILSLKQASKGLKMIENRSIIGRLILKP